MIELKFKTPVAWAEGIVNAMDVFLPDHAAAEKKASSMAMTMVSHYPDRPELVAAMIDLALEELSHFRSVVKIMQERGVSLFLMASDHAFIKQGAARLVAAAKPNG